MFTSVCHCVFITTLHNAFQAEFVLKSYNPYPHSSYDRISYLIYEKDERDLNRFKPLSHIFNEVKYGIISPRQFPLNRILVKTLRVNTVSQKSLARN